MALTKYAAVEQILEVKSSPQRLAYSLEPGAGFARFAALNDGVREDDGFLYVRCRAISSRVNKNNDGWPSAELAAAYGTFEGRPIFVDHNNNDPKRTRGVIVSSKLYREEDEEKISSLDPYYATAPDEHKPPTWIELLLEVDAETYPQLAKEVRSGNIDAVSMGANIDRSVCSVCSNEATTPSEYCSHIKQKGIEFEIEASNGERIRKKAYEDCYGINFFEISFVFDPADETALISEKKGHVEEAEPQRYSLEELVGQHIHLDDLDEFVNTFDGKWTSLAHYKASKTAAPSVDLEQFIEPAGTKHHQDNRNHTPQSDLTTAPQNVDTLRDEHLCPNCHADQLEADPDAIMRCPTCGYVQEPEPLNNPDLETARDTDLRQDNQVAEDQDGNIAVPADAEEQIEFQPVGPVNPVQRATKATISGQGISDMWETTLTTTSQEMADKLLPAVEGAVTDTTVGFRGGIHFGTHMAFKNAGIAATVTYTAVEGDNVQQIPGNPIKDFMLANRSMKSLGLESPAEVPISVDSENLEQALEIIHAGGMGAGPMGGEEAGMPPMGASKKAAETPANKKPVLPQEPNRTTDEPKGAQVVKDQLEPVEADRRTIEREEREENGAIIRSERILEETGEGAPVEVAPEVVEQEPAPEEAPAEEEESTEAESLAYASEQKLLAAFALAEDAVDIGLVEKAEKMAFVAELEKESMEQLEARRSMLARVKSAGLSKKAARVAGNGLARVPRLAHAVASNGNGIGDNTPDEAIFL